MAKRQSTWHTAGIIALGGLISAGCGGGGDGGGGAGTATVSGNLASASTAAVRAEKRSWLAWAGEEVLGLARRAYAQVTDSSLDGVTVTVSGGAGAASATTDGEGDFEIPGAPTGDVTIGFARGSCRATISLPDVVDGSVLTLHDVAVNCDDGTVAELDETFQAVLQNKPASPNGNLNVCAFGGGGNHVRAVKTKNGADFEDPSGAPATFADLEEGDLIEVTGQRSGVGANSALDASLVKIIASGQTGKCSGLPTPTPEPTSEPTAIPSATPTP